MESNFSGPIWGTASSAPTGEEQESFATRPGATKLPEKSQRRKMYPKEQWLALKPIIKQLYVNEGRTFTKVAEYLAEHHDFHPTKKQFMRKISEWGFEKNIKRSERLAILERLGAGAHAAEFETRMLRGRKLDKAKIERWKKREGLSGGGSQIGLTHSSGLLEETPNLSAGSYLLSSEMELCDQDDAQEDLPRQREHLLSMPIDQQSTFNPWLLVDVVGSPRLTKLIGALTIDLCEDIPSLDLSAPYSDESDDDKDSMDLDGICSSMLYRKAHNQQSPAKTTSHSVSYRNTSLSSYFSNRTQRRMPGPLDELYPFPKSASPRQLFRRPRTNHLISGYAMKIKELECMKKFKTLKSMQPLEINELAEDMRSIAWRHYELEQFVLAESWWRRVVNSCLQIPGFQPFKVLQACLQVVSNVQLQGRHNEALSLHQRIHHKIVKLVGPNHQFAIFSKEKLANILRSLGENDSEIAIFREVLQYCLLQFGPRSRDTLDVLRFLGYALISGSQYREAEAILCHTVELDCELASCIDRDVIDAQNSLYSMTGLACSLNDQKRFEDSKSVLNTAEEWFKDTIKIESPFCWQYFRRRAVVLRCEGRLLESEEILRAVVNHAPDYPDIEIKLAMIELAEISMETGQQAEAATWWEKNFIMGGELWGFDYKCSRYDCEILGFCYARQGRYNDAILHFQQTIEKLALINGGNLGSRKKYIEVIEDWILEVEEMKEQHRRWNTEDSSTEGLSTENSSMEDATAS